MIDPPLSRHQPDRIEIVAEGITVSGFVGCANLKFVWNEKVQVIVEHRQGADDCKAQSDDCSRAIFGISS
jgi:hypothetical protein